MNGYLLAHYDCETRVVSYDSLNAVCNDANRWGADLFVSNHFNADGYIYAKSLNPAIFAVKQTKFGNSISVTLTGIATGSATVRLFNGGGAFKDIAVTVTS